MNQRCPLSLFGLFNHVWDHVEFVRTGYDTADAMVPIEGMSHCVRCHQPYARLEDRARDQRFIEKREYGFIWRRTADGRRWYKYGQDPAYTSGL